MRGVITGVPTGIALWLVLLWQPWAFAGVLGLMIAAVVGFRIWDNSKERKETA